MLGDLLRRAQRRGGLAHGLEPEAAARVVVEFPFVGDADRFGILGIPGRIETPSPVSTSFLRPTMREISRRFAGLRPPLTAPTGRSSATHSFFKRGQDIDLLLPEDIGGSLPQPFSDPFAFKSGVG
jgi:hypothetical protein